MDRCWLQGAMGDALHAISCAAGYNLRWLLRALARLGIEALLLRLLQAALSGQRVTMIQERVRAGLARAKARGTKSGKPIGRPTGSEATVDHIRELRAEGLGMRKIAA